jgi:hypothetical protein
VALGIKGLKVAPPKLTVPVAERTLWSRPKKGEWTVSSHGRGDPINLYLHGTLEDVRASFTRAGWVEPKPNDLKDNTEYVAAAGEQVAEKETRATPWQPLSSRARATVKTMPVSVMTLDGQPPDVAFERDNDPLHGRHHLRIFDTGKKDEQDRIVWAVAVVRDTGINFAPKRPEQGFLGHAVEKNTTPERDWVVSQLEETGRVSSAERFELSFGPPGEPGTYSGDSKAVDVVLSQAKVR